MEKIEIFVIDAPWEQRKGDSVRYGSIRGVNLIMKRFPYPAFSASWRGIFFRLQKVTIVYSCGRQSDICPNARRKCPNVDTDAIAGWCGTS